MIDPIDFAIGFGLGLPVCLGIMFLLLEDNKYLTKLSERFWR